MKKSRVVIFEFQDIRYASRARKEAFSLSKNGYIVTLVGFNRENKGSKIERSEYDVKIIEFSFSNLLKDKFLGKVLNIFLMNFKLLLFFTFNKFDIYHLHNIKPLLPTLIASCFGKKKIIYDTHELHIRKREGKKFKTKILNKFDEINERILIKVAFKVIQASESRAIFFAEYYKTERPIVIENHSNLIEIDSNIVGVREKLNLSSNDKIIVFTGNISIGGNQRIDNVIKSLKYLSENVFLCLLGRGSISTIKKLKAIAFEVGVEKRFQILSPVKSEEVVSAISSADIGIIPIYAKTLNSKYSALNKLSQSLMAGLALATSNNPNLLKEVENNEIGRLGYVFDVNNPQSIAKSITSILTNNIDLLKTNAKKLAKKRINWENEEKKLITLYSDLQ